MRTAAALLFIAGMAALAVALARMPTIADGRVMAADRLVDVRKDGVIAMECDPKIPIGRQGAAFTCIATLGGGATQVVEYVLHPDGQIAWKPQPPTHTPRPRKPASGDPWSNRP